MQGDSEINRPFPLPSLTSVEQDTTLPSFRDRETFSLSSTPSFASMGRGTNARNTNAITIINGCTIFGTTVFIIQNITLTFDMPKV